MLNIKWIIRTNDSRITDREEQKLHSEPRPFLGLFMELYLRLA